jgi:hypothetical protein
VWPVSLNKLKVNMHKTHKKLNIRERLMEENKDTGTP